MSHIYNFSVYSQMKDEDYILPYFLEHYIKLNFDHIYILDDNSQNPISELDCVKPLIEGNKVTVFRLDYTFDDFLIANSKFTNSIYYDSVIHKTETKVNQTYLMRFFASKYKNVNKYVFFCDADEFLYIRDFDTIDKFIDSYSSIDFTAIHFFWVMFGSSYHKHFPKEKHIFENFLLSDKYIYIETKYIVDISKITDLNNITLHLFNLDSNNVLFTQPYSTELCTIMNFTQKYFEPMKGKNNIHKFNDMNVFIAHFHICGLYEFYKRKLRKGCNNYSRLFHFKKFALSYNDSVNTLLYDKYIKNDNKNLVVQKTGMNLDINKYNKIHKKKFADNFHVLVDSFEHNRELYFI